MKFIDPQVFVINEGTIRETQAIQTIAIAARTCYKSHAGQAPEESLKLLAKLAKNDHLTPFEQVVIPIAITCSRSCSHQLVRHRHFSFCQESQRFVRLDDPEFIKPEGFDDWPNQAQDSLVTLLQDSIRVYQKLINSGLKNQQARAVLPNCIATRMVMTGNLRAWFEFLDKRLFTPGADSEMQGVANLVLTALRASYPRIMEVWL